MSDQSTDNLSEDEINQRANEKNRKRKEARERMLATKTIQKGLIIVHTGTGKGKSTAAFGLVLRMVGNGGKCAVVQFIKGAWNTGERSVLESFGDMVRWYTLGEGFTWETQDKARDLAAAAKAWETAKKLMQDPDLKLIVLDEINIALRYDYLPLAEVVETLKNRRPDLHVVVTGRNAKREMIEAADLVTEMTLVKHHFAEGVKAQAGIEY
jgi:cob(I)alamin adenosyltransferase